MKQRITIKDVAREANVSVATVSYIINNREDQKISDATRNRVLHTINMLGYQTNTIARSLVTGKINNLAIVFPKSLLNFTDMEKWLFLSSFATYCKKRGFSLYFLPDSYTDKIENVCAIIAVGLPKNEFYELGNNNFSPIIAVDCILNDPIFFQVNTNYQKLKELFPNASPILYDLQNAEYKAEIMSVFPKAQFVCKIEDIASLSLNNSYTIEESLATLINAAGYTVENKSQPLTRKISTVFDCIEYSVNRDKDKSHDIKI